MSRDANGWDASVDDFSKRNDRALNALKGVLADISEVTGKTPAVLVADAMKSVLIGGNNKPGLYQQGRAIRPDKGQIFSDMGGQFTGHGVRFQAPGKQGPPPPMHAKAQSRAAARFSEAAAYDKRGKPTSIYVRITGYGDPNTVKATPVRVTKAGKLGATRRTRGTPINPKYKGANLSGTTLDYSWRGKQAKLDGVVAISLIQYTAMIDFELRRQSIGYYAQTFRPNSSDGSLNALRSVRRGASTRGPSGAQTMSAHIRTTDKRGTQLELQYVRPGPGGSYARGKMLGLTRFNQDQHNPNRYASGVIEAVLEDRLNYFARKLNTSLDGLLAKRYGGTALGGELGAILWPEPF